MREMEGGRTVRQTHPHPLFNIRGIQSVHLVEVCLVETLVDVV